MVLLAHPWMHANEIFSLLGHNGAGKTTSINVLTGILASDSREADGGATIFGHPIRLKKRMHVLVLRAVDATALLVVRAVDATASPYLPLPNASGAKMWRFGLGPLEGFPSPRRGDRNMFRSPAGVPLP